MFESPKLVRCLLAFGVSLFIAGFAFADAIVWRNADGRPGSEFKDVRFLRVEDGKLIYLAGGNERNRELDRIFRITVNDDPALNDAEAAFVEGKFSQAVDGYQRVVRGQQEWKRKYVLPRLMMAAQQASRFDAATTAYLTLLRTEGASAGTKPTIVPNVGAGMLDAAAREIETTLGQLPAADALRQPLLSLLLDIHRARDDAPAIARTLQQLTALVGSDSANSPEMQAVLASVRLDQAQVAFDQKKFAEVKKLVDEVGPLLVDTQQQVRALSLLARSVDAQAGTNAAQLQDAALAYLRIVAHFPADEERGARDQALLAAASCLERANDLEEAKTLLMQYLAQTPAPADASVVAAKLEQINKRITSNN